MLDRWSTESTIEIEWPRLNPGGHMDGTGRPDAVQRVRSSQNLPSEGVTALFRVGAYK
jgi:hypothetical protein